MDRNRVRVYLAVTIVVLISITAAVWTAVPGCRRSAVPASASQPAVTVSAAASQDGVYLYFSPRGNATAAIVEQIKQARQTLEIQAYQFTSLAIAEAVLDAHKRGVQIEVILDPTQEGNRGPGREATRYSSALFLYNQGIKVFIDRRHAIAHNKVMLIDGRTIITGSFNFTTAAQESNAENLLVILNKPDLYAAYERNFRTHLKHSIPYEGRDTREQAPSRSQRGRSSRQPAPAR